VRVLQRDLPVVGAVRDQERHGDLLDDAVQVDVVGEVDERVQVEGGASTSPANTRTHAHRTNATTDADTHGGQRGTAPTSVDSSG
jgi:hypothetical protein